MVPSTALLRLTTAGALLLVRFGGRKLNRFGVFLALAAVLLAEFAAIRYLLEPEGTMLRYGTSLRTALGFLVVLCGVLSLSRANGFLYWFDVRTPGGRATAHAAIGAVLAPILIAFAAGQGARLGLGSDALISAVVAATAAMMAFGIWWATTVRREYEALTGALTRSEERLHIALVAAKAGAWEREMGAEAGHWSPQVFDLFGFPRSHRPGPGDWLNRVAPQDRDRVLDAFKHARQTQERFEILYRIIRADTGETRWIEDSGQYFYDAGDAPVRSAGVVVDATERMQTLSALRTREERLRLVADAGGIGKIDWNFRTGTIHRSLEYFLIQGLDPASPNDTTYSDD